MAGAAKKRNQRERQTAASSHAASSQSHSASDPESAPQSQGPRSSEAVSPAFDGNRDPQPGQSGVSAAMEGAVQLSNNVKNVDLGGKAWSMVRGHKVDLARRPNGLSKLGREVTVELNTFAVKMGHIKVYQYQVLIGSGAEKRGLIKKAWRSQAVQSQLPKAQSWIFDGNTLAWSTEEIAEKRVQVDLDAEQGLPARRDGRTNSHRVIIKKTGLVDFTSLTAYINGQADFNNKCLEAITFADHLMRESPSQRLTQIKRSFFARGQSRHTLGGGIEAFKGVYQSIRVAHPSSLTVNVDVANGTFWTAGPLWQTVIAVARLRGEAEIGNILSDRARNQFNELKRLRKLHVYCNHRKSKNKDGTRCRDEYVIDRFLNKDATTHMLDMKDRPQVSVAQYFLDTHNMRLRNPKWPVIQMTKKAVLPLELLYLDENQRYVYKLDDRQTASMIKVAVTAPAQRWGDIEHGLGLLSWANDPYLKAYGMQISPTPTKVKGRILQNPKLVFNNKPDTDPRTSGRWDLKGKRFAATNPIPLKSWGVCVVNSRGMADQASVQRFMVEFVKIYTAHGGNVVTKQPHMMLSTGTDAGKCCEELWVATGNKFQARPQILVFILADKDATFYGRIKRSAECRYGVMSQCMQSAHVMRCQAQYISNVCMKFNAKLGGYTNRAVGAKSGGPYGILRMPTVVIGCDVSHAAPGSQASSMAAMTVSMDALATRYASACETNGYRLEMVTAVNINTHLKELLRQWVVTVGKGQFPRHIIYFRDGVSEGQFSHVLEQEVGEIKKMLKIIDPNTEKICKFLVIVASKRHHVRFFPKDNADKNGNPLPGTLIETGVTHPFENDFYMCSHAALKGTARPVHYNVLINETDLTQDEIHTMIYEHCYQYIRATTPVSLFPAVYYAHLASKRAVHHDKNFAGANSNERLTKPSKVGGQTVSSQTPEDFPPLMQMPELKEMHESQKIRYGMWYI
ncbi:hypothetical protein MBLNU459_g0002t1 [Dothideomycetes sp. NU459]